MPTSRKVTANEAETLLATDYPHVEKQLELDEEFPVQVYDGNSHFSNDFIAGEDATIVKGDLVVDGFLGDWPDFSLLVVLGNLSAKNLLFRGQLIVTGNINVERLIYLNSFNDHEFLACGNLKAEAFVEEGMYSVVEGEISATTVLSLQNEIRQGRGDAQKTFVERRTIEASTVFKPAVLNDGYPDMDNIREILKSGEDVLI